MKTEYEATFTNIDKDLVRQRLKEAGAILIKPEFMQKRVVFHFPEGHEREGAWARVRDEGDKITMSLKQVINGKIEDQQEACFEISDFEEGKKFLEFLGCKAKAYQETRRELWKLGNAEITIDEWPFLEPIVEIEDISEDLVKNTAKQIGFDYNQAYFGSIDGVYSKKYGVSEERVNNQTPRLVFEDKNPFLNQS